MDTWDERYVQLHSFSEALHILEKNWDLVEIQPDVYEKLPISKEEAKTMVTDIQEHAPKYFTIQNLWYTYSDTFFHSLFMNSDMTSFWFGGQWVFSLEENADVSAFLHFVLDEQTMSVSQCISYLQSIYGLRVDRSYLMARLKDARFLLLPRYRSYIYRKTSGYIRTREVILNERAL